MPRCKLTTMNLRNIRKSREYQCLLIDFVKMGVVGKSDAESILGYTIPVGLLNGTSSEPTEPTEPTEPEADPEADPETGTGTGVTVTLLYLSTDLTTDEQSWKTQEYISESTDLGAEEAHIVDAARNAFGLSVGGYDLTPVELNPDYVEGESSVSQKYSAISPSPSTLTDGMLIKCTIIPSGGLS